MDDLGDLLRDQPSIFKSDLGKSGWSSEDTTRQLAYFTLHGADWAQTRTTAKNPGLWHENNPLLGSHPSSGQVNNYFLATGLGHLMLMNLLPSDWRKWAQYGTIGLEAGQVRANKMIGIGFTF